jgi:hypothetical protein
MHTQLLEDDDQDSRFHSYHTIAVIDRKRRNSVRDRVLRRAQRLTPLLFARIYANDWQRDRPRFWKRLTMDMIAGVTVGAMVVPQAMSFATVAGLQPVYGLYNAFAGILTYPLFGWSLNFACCYLFFFWKLAHRNFNFRAR